MKWTTPLRLGRLGGQQTWTLAECRANRTHGTNHRNHDLVLQFVTEVTEVISCWDELWLLPSRRRGTKRSDRSTGREGHEDMNQAGSPWFTMVHPSQAARSSPSFLASFLARSVIRRRSTRPKGELLCQTSTRHDRYVQHEWGSGDMRGRTALNI